MECVQGLVLRALRLFRRISSLILFLDALKFHIVVNFGMIVIWHGKNWMRSKSWPIDRFLFRLLGLTISQFLSLLQCLYVKQSIRDRVQSSYSLLFERLANTNGPKQQALVKVWFVFIAPNFKQLNQQLTSLSHEVTSLQAQVTLFHQNSSLRAEQFSSSHLQPATYVTLSAEAKIIVFDSLWNEALSRTGYGVYGPLRKRENELFLSEEVLYFPDLSHFPSFGVL